MVERSQDFRFTLKASEAFRIGGHFGGQHSNGNIAPELCNGSAVYLAHATRTYPLADLEVAKLRARFHRLSVLREEMPTTG